MALTAPSPFFPHHTASVRHKVRKDIQGLRALSVIVIVLFHLDLSIVPGGYVGVDIFMVISGFLITGSLLSEKSRDSSGKDYFLPFWDRRIRRLFPALLLTLTFCFALGWVSLEPEEYRNFSTSAVFAIFYSLNIYLTGSLDYFAASASMNYLLHIWSLALEEQFYIILPIALFFLRAKRGVGAWIVGIWTLSFALSLISMISGKGESYAFYLLPTRMWEFLTGSLLALHMARAPTSRSLCLALGGIGLSLIFLSVLFLDEFVPFPGIAALAPVIGTACLILAGTTQQDCSGVVQRIVGWSPIQKIGDMSYSIYLLHWPVVVFTRHFYGEELLSPARAPILIAVILLFSWLSWKFVETPFRSTDISARRFYSATMGAVGLLLVIAAVIIAKDGFPERVDPRFQAETTAEERTFGAYKLSCSRNIGKVDAPEDFCSFGSPEADRSILVWGDSHASVLVAALHKVGLREKFAGRIATLGGCAPVPSHAPASSPHCAEITQKVLNFAIQTSEVETVVLHARWANLFGLGPFGSERMKSSTHAEAHAYYGQPSIQNQMIANLTRMVKDLQAADKKVIIVGPVPEVGRLVLNAARIQSRVGVSPNFELTWSDVQARQAPLIAALQYVHVMTGANLLLPSLLYCDDNRCEVTEGNVPGNKVLYVDNDHLSVFGAKRMANALASQLKP